MNSLQKEKLIEEVRKYNYLYDLQDSKYSNNIKKDEAWRQISRALNCPEPECKKIWNNLRESHRRAMKRKKTQSGMAATTNKKWVFEDEMSFLLPHYKERPTIASIDTSSVSSVDLEDDENSNLSSILHDSQLSQVTDNPISPSRPPLASSPLSELSNNTPVRKKKKIEESSASAELMKFLLKEKSSKKDDDIDNFCLGIAATIKKFNEYDQAIIKKKIYLLVSDMDLKRIAENAESNQSRQTAQDECPTNTPEEDLIVLETHQEDKSQETDLQTLLKKTEYY